MIKELLKNCFQIVFKPKEKLSLSEWCEKYIRISSIASSTSGKYSLRNYTYLKGIYDSIENSQVVKVVILKSTQSGLTTLSQNVILWYVCNRNLPITYFTSTKDGALKFSKRTLQPTIEALEPIQALRTNDEDQETNLYFRFINCIVKLGWAGSLSSLASDPAAVVVCDEISKWTQSKNEASSIDLALARTIASVEKKQILLSTPAEESSCAVYQQFLEGDQQEFMVLSPYTGERFTITIDMLQKPEVCRDRNGNYDFNLIKKGTWLADPTTKTWNEQGELTFIGRPILEKDKAVLVRTGIWVPFGELDETKRPQVKDPDCHSFRVTSLFSMDTSWGTLLTKFIQASDDTEKLKELKTQYLGQPWQQRTISTNTSYIDNIIKKGKEAGIYYSKGIVPRKCEYLIGAVDSQKDRYPYVVSALCSDGTTYIVDYGEALDFEVLKDIGTKKYPLQGDPTTTYEIDRMLIDEGGFEKAPVRNFSVSTNFQFTCCKGNSSKKKGQGDTDGLGESEIKMNTSYKVTTMDHEGYSIPFFWVNDKEYKNRIVGTYFQQGKTKIFFPYDISDDFKKQVTNESLDQVKSKNGSFIYEWRSHGPNHYLDCVKYTEALRDHYLTYIPDEEASTEVIDIQT